MYQISEPYKAFDGETPYFTTFTLVEWLHLSDIQEFGALMQPAHVRK